ncbi:MAG: ATPase domain-containing protein [Phycisphaerae bacterium]
MSKNSFGSADRLSTGLRGLDEVLGGGLVPDRTYLIEGDPGSGKTTLSLQFLLAGIERGETCLFITLSESAKELRATAKSHGWSLDKIHILEIIPSEESLKPDSRYTMYHPSEIELSQTTKRVLEEAEKLRPDRVVIDSLSEVRLLAESSLRYRRQILALKLYFSRQEATVLLIHDFANKRDLHLYSLAHGVIMLEQKSPEYGGMRRRLLIKKMRGQPYTEGYHDFVISTGGLLVYPRLIAAEHEAQFIDEEVPTGMAQLDALLGGGLSRGTSALITGASGTGKSSVATIIAKAAADRGENSFFFLFDESEETFKLRAHKLGIDIEPHLENGRIKLRRIDPAELSPGQFADAVRRAVRDDKSRIVVVDSLSGYLHAMASDRHLLLHLHELLTYLGQEGILTILILTQHGLVGESTISPIDASYLADTVMILRYFEAFGEVRQAISVIKRRTGLHERTIREMRFGGPSGLLIGEPLREFQGVLHGLPRFVGDSLPNIKSDHGE